MTDRTTAVEAYERRDWSTVHRLLIEQSDDDVPADDLERLAVAAYLIGEDDEAVAAWERAYRRHLDAGDVAAAGVCAFSAALSLMLRGQPAHAGGWFGRTEEAIGDVDCPAAGFLLIPRILGALHGGNLAEARELSERAREIADRFDDPDLQAFATLGDGQALLAMGDARGMARLDDVMLSVTAGEVGPITTGIVYCAVILECMQIHDLARAAEWTEALDHWCAGQPDLVPYRGQCLVHQSQLQQAAGDWSRAVSTVSAACDRLTDPPHPARGLAYYQQAELHRLRGEHDAAAEAYRRAAHAGHDPMPGLALLDAARGALDDAAASLRRALGEAVEAFKRPTLLAAAVDVLVAAGDIDAAGDAADELAEIASRSPSEMLTGMAEHAAGAVLLAAGTTSDGLVHLRAAADIWRRLGLPYEAARTSVLVGRACRDLGDRTLAALELDAARDAFASLGAAQDLADLSGVDGSAATPEGADVLSVREREVLAEVAAGKTNPEIAEALSISRHTVGRHLENIYAKLGVNSRAALTAHAYEHDLL